jgi:hypothetical protein
MQQTYRLSESLNPGYVVTRASGTSSRPGSELSFRIAGGNQEATFAMTPAGELKVERGLDYERVRRYSLWLGIRDVNTDPPLEDYLQLSIEITDENDCLPVFDELYHNATVAENQFPGVLVATVTASDCDSGDNGRITYALAEGGGAGGGAFAVDENTGRITTQMQLDREVTDRYTLVLTAADHVSNSYGSLYGFYSSCLFNLIIQGLRQLTKNVLYKLMLLT